MIELTRGNLLNADVDAIVNTVNCVGIMGKGLALQFKQAFPDNNLYYERACAKHEVVPGRMFIYDNGTFANPRYVINFPTKRHWKGQSKIEDIALGLRSLIAEIERLGIESIAVPPLGCGLGGLDWSTVKPVIEEAFALVPDVRVLLYEPGGEPKPNQMLLRPAITLPIETYGPEREREFDAAERELAAVLRKAPSSKRAGRAKRKPLSGSAFREMRVPGRSTRRDRWTNRFSAGHQSHWDCRNSDFAIRRRDRPSTAAANMAGAQASRVAADPIGTCEGNSGGSRVAVYLDKSCLSGGYCGYSRVSLATIPSQTLSAIFSVR